jgi:hypothetical protein
VFANQANVSDTPGASLSWPGDNDLINPVITDEHKQALAQSVPHGDHQPLEPNGIRQSKYESHFQNFGKITSTLSPRVIQFGMKMFF